MRVLIAWEFGSNWGHLAALLPLAQELRQRGHDVMFAVRGIDGDLSLLTAAGFMYLQLPVAIAPLQKMHQIPVRGYADVLARGGFTDARTLTQLALAWLGVLHCVDPDVVVCKYAPLAEFATCDRPVLSIGTGFELPPLSEPMPSYGFKSVAASDALQVLEGGVLAAVNVAGLVLNSATYTSAFQAFSHVHRILLTSPELDHFGPRVDGKYLGAVEDLSSAVTTPLELERYLLAPNAPLRLAYLRMGANWAQEFLKERRLGSEITNWVVVDPTLTREQCALLTESSCLFLNVPFDIKVWAFKFDIFVCHAGHGMVNTALRSEKPLLMMPQYADQVLLAERVIGSQFAGAAVATILPPQHPVQVLDVVRKLAVMTPPQRPSVCNANAISTLSDCIELLSRAGQ